MKSDYGKPARESFCDIPDEDWNRIFPKRLDEKELDEFNRKEVCGE